MKPYYEHGNSTTAMVAQKFGRKSISIELNEDYLQMQINRINTESGVLGRSEV